MSAPTERDVDELDEAGPAPGMCAECSHEHEQHLDPRWPCSVLSCGCRGFKQRTGAEHDDNG